MISLRPLFIAAAALVAAIHGPGMAYAQQTGQPMSDAERVEELSRVLGRAHYLRALCNGLEDQTWRNAMRGVLNVEARAGQTRRGALIAIFNDGYRYEEERFPSCTEEAREANRVLSAQGKRLADALAARFRE